MKVLIVNNMAPFVWGGAEELASHLVKNLIVAGHEAQVLRIPFQWEPPERIPSQMLLARALELPNVDHVIALKFPAYLVRHPRKTIWLLHQYRQAYDLYDSGHGNLSGGGSGVEIRSMITCADNSELSRCRRIYTNSEVTRNRLYKYNQILGEVLRPPVNDPELFGGGGGGGYIFAGGRVNSTKRQHLLVEALALCNSHTNLIIGGPPDSVADEVLLRSTVERLGLKDRVKLDLRFLPRSEYASYINGASAVAYLPYDEDSLGYVAMEAATAGKALITTLDSGGILGLVRDGDTGWVAQPNVDDLARVMSLVFENSLRCKEYGNNARALLASMGINWPETVGALLQ